MERSDHVFIAKLLTVTVLFIAAMIGLVVHDERTRHAENEALCKVIACIEVPRERNFKGMRR